MISYVKVRYEDRSRGRIAFVAVDRQDKLNSLSSEVMGELTALFKGLAPVSTTARRCRSAAPTSTRCR